MELLKILASLLGGGLAGAFFNEWLRRRSSRLQSIPLIERVNRRVDPKLEGFTLARVGGSDGRDLEEVKNVREYQFTLRNSSTIHLQDVEIQFEFPTEDIDGWASRPALSKTAPLPVESSLASPWKKGFRWRIPHLPSSDSIEFSFKAVNPPTANYEVALFNADRVVIERSEREPTARRSEHLIPLTRSLLLLLAIIAFMVPITDLLLPGRASELTPVDGADCALTVVSSYEKFVPSSWPFGGPWRITDEVTNIGDQVCPIQSDRLAQTVVLLAPKAAQRKTTYSTFRPKLVAHAFRSGTEQGGATIAVRLYDPVGK